MKSVQINEKIHNKLKIYCAYNEQKITETVENILIKFFTDIQFDKRYKGKGKGNKNG